MSNKQLRILLRWAHIIEGALIAAFIYSSTLQSSAIYSGLVQFVIVPLVILSGILMWQQPKVNKLMARWRKREDNSVTA